MKVEITLVLIGLCLSQALALTCVGSSGTCPTTSDRCGFSYIDLVTTKPSISNCTSMENCVSGSISTAFVNLTINTLCCDYDNCNNFSSPPGGQLSNPPNGKYCNSCFNQNCSSLVNCYGGQDRCINATVSFPGSTTNITGCATKSICDGTPLYMSSQLKNNISNIACYRANSAEDVKLSLFIMLVPLLSFIFFL